MATLSHLFANRVGGAFAGVVGAVGLFLPSILAYFRQVRASHWIAVLNASIVLTLICSVASRWFLWLTLGLWVGAMVLALAGERDDGAGLDDPAQPEPYQPSLPFMVFLALLLGGYLVFYQLSRHSNRKRPPSISGVIHNLRRLAAAKEQWALEHKPASNAWPSKADLLPYLGNLAREQGFDELVPPRLGEIYLISRVDLPPAVYFTRDAYEITNGQILTLEDFEGPRTTLGQPAADTNTAPVAAPSAAVAASTSGAILLPDYDLAEAVFRPHIRWRRWPPAEFDRVYCLCYGASNAPLPADFMDRFPGSKPRVTTGTNSLVFGRSGMIFDRESGRKVVILSLRRLSVHGDDAGASLIELDPARSIRAECLYKYARTDGRWTQRWSQTRGSSQSFPHNAVLP